MARVILTMEMDGGGVMEFTEVSAVAIYGGTDAILLVQSAFEKAARACGVKIATPEERAAAEAAVAEERRGENPAVEPEKDPEPAAGPAKKGS